MLLVPLLALAFASGEGGMRDGAPWHTASTGLPANNNYYGVAFGDFNNDGCLDVVGAAESTGLKVYLGDGKGNWTAVASQPAANGGFNDVRVGDLDNDGNMDIVAGTTGIKFYMGNGNGGFTDKTAGSGLPTSNNWRGIALGDVNNDGNLDVAATSGWGSTGGIQVWTGDGAAKFKNNSSGLPGNQDRDSAITLADYNSDGNLDLAAGGSPGVAVYLGNGGAGGAMSWTASSTGLPSGRFSGVNSTDFNSDGVPDLVLGAYNGGSGVGLRAYRNVNKGASWTSASTGLNNSGDYIDVSTGDLDGDGNIDMVTAGSYGSSRGIQVFYGDGNGSWQWNSTGLPLGDQWIGNDVGDFNNDGNPDFLMGSYNGLGLRVYQNMRFTPPPPPQPRLSLAEPLGNVSWTGGSRHGISWNATNGTAPYNISLGYAIDSGPVVPIAGPLFQADNGSGSFDWAVPLVNSSGVKVVVNLTDSLEQKATDSSPWDFEIDSAPPAVTYVLPADGSLEVSNGTSVAIRFGEAMNSSSVVSAVSIAGPGAPALAHVPTGGGVFVFQTSGLLLESRYDITVNASATDDSDPGNPMAAPHTFSFNTSSASIPAISLSSPAGGEVWVAGTAQSITWNAAGGTGNLSISLEYSTTGPNGTWIPVASKLTNSGVHTWTVPNSPSTDCYVRATVADGFTPPKLATDSCRSPFTINEAASPLSVNLTAPDGGEVWKAGTVQNITWSSSGGNGNKTVAIDYSASGPSGPWTDIASNSPDTGLFRWTVPNTPSISCYARVTARDSYSPPQTARDASAAAFTIKGTPAPLNITLTSPNGGESWMIGTLHTISWRASGGVSPLSVRFDYSTTGAGGPWTLISANEDNDGSSSWTVPGTASTNCFVQATIDDSDDLQQVASDESDRAFTIAAPQSDTQAPQVQITSPADGAVVSGVVHVQLVATDNVLVTGMELFIDGASFGNFTLSPAAADWDTSGVADGRHTITARARDAAGNVGTAAAVNVTVRNSKKVSGEQDFMQKYGLLLVIALTVLVVAVLAALMMRRRPRDSLPADAPVPGPGSVLGPQPSASRDGGQAPAVGNGTASGPAPGQVPPPGPPG
jgi:hypothetical protein